MLERLCNAFEKSMLDSDFTGIVTIFPKKNDFDYADATLRGPSWIQAVPLTDFEAADGSEAPVKTLVKVFYDEKNLYFNMSANCRDGAAMEADALAQTGGAPLKAERFEITIVDGKSAVLHHKFAVGPSGALYSSNPKSKWSARASVNVNGWCAYASIPWSDIGSKPDDEVKAMTALARIVKEKGKDAEIYKIGDDGREMLKICLDKNVRKLKGIKIPVYQTADFVAGNFRAPSGKRNNNFYPPFRFQNEIVIWGDKGENAEFTLVYNQVGKEPQASSDELVLVGPNGASVTAGWFDYVPEKMPGNASLTFKCIIPETGCYRLKLNPGFNGYIFKGGPALRWAVRGADGQSRTVLIRPTANPIVGYFEVPAGVKEFIVEFIGGAGADLYPMPMRIKNQKGEVVKETVGFEMPTTMKVRRTGDASEIWSFEVENARAAIYVRMPKPLLNIWANSPGNLPRLK